MPSDDDDLQLPDVRSPEHRRALRERGAPHGDHIRDDEDMRRPHLDRDTTIATLLADIRDGQRAARQAAVPPPRFSWGALGGCLGAVVALISIVASAVAVIQGYTQLGERVQSFGERMLANDGRITVLERSFQERGQKRDGEVAVLTANNTLQDERMRNFAIALEQERQARMESEADIRRSAADLRQQSNEVAKNVSEMKSDLKVLVDRAQRSRSELPQAQRDAQVVPGR